VASTARVRSARFDELPIRTFHDIVRLRVDSFVVEQRCPYPELDGLDVQPDTRHVWLEEDGEVLGYLRVYPGVDGTAWIGRVVTAPAHRGRGIGARLMESALAATPRPVLIKAQSRLADWYAGFGFIPCGEEFVEDAIPHTPMRLDG
jgi:ElaA protein